MAQAKRKKRFFNVEIPIIGRTTQVQAYELKELDWRHIKYDLTRILKGKSILLTVKINIKDEKAEIIAKEIKILPYYLKRLTRKGTSYVENSFLANCKNSQIRIKPFLITRKKVSRRIRKALREASEKELQEYVKNKSSEEIFDDILRNKLQKGLSMKLKKIYPLSVCEIRILKVEHFLKN